MNSKDLQFLMEITNRLNILSSLRQKKSDYEYNWIVTIITSRPIPIINLLREFGYKVKSSTLPKWDEIDTQVRLEVT
jgi:hypothetical protein